MNNLYKTPAIHCKSKKIRSNLINLDEKKISINLNKIKRCQKFTPTKKHCEYNTYDEDSDIYIIKSIYNLSLTKINNESLYKKGENLSLIESARNKKAKKFLINDKNNSNKTNNFMNISKNSKKDLPIFVNQNIKI